MVRVLHHLNADAAASLAAEFPSVEFISIPATVRSTRTWRATYW